jgi:major vault protein
MLNEDEELWEKQMPANIEKIVLKDSFAERNSKNDENLRKKWQVIEYRVPHNGAVQIYDYKQKKSRVVFGPELVMLNPDEQFNMISFSFFYTIVFLIIVCNLRNFFVKILKFLRII